MTEPLTPPDCDLRDFPFLPMAISQLFGSRFHAVTNDSEWRAGVTLWLKSFHQVPAASLPDDDVELARLAELGRDVRTWRKVRSGALHGWIKCSDGRLYHPVVAEKAKEAWKKKELYRERSRKANAKRWGEASSGNGMEASQGAQKDERSCVDGDDQGRTKVSYKEASRNPPASQVKERESKGRVKEEGSVSKDTGTATVLDFPKNDPKRHFWESAKAYLGPAKAGMVGKWARDFGQDETAKAITAAQVHGAVDPVPYIEKMLRGGKRAGADVTDDGWELPIC